MLSILGKVLESIIADEIDTHFLHNPGTNSNKHQWGFKKGRSPELLMLHLTETWKEALDRGTTVGVLFIDFKKAFDSVCHTTLSIKMQASGISGNLLDWLNDYLKNRRQFVKIGDHKSDIKRIDYGVPQRSLWVQGYLE